MSAYPLSKPLPLTEKEKARGILAKVQTYGEDYDGPTGMGAIADEFRKRPGAILGPGFHRVCAWGREAELHSKGYQYLLEIDGLVLLLGVDITSCSSMHQAEKVGFPPEIAEAFRVSDEIRRDYPDDIYLACSNVQYDAWEKVQTEADRLGLIKRHRLGQADCMLFRARPVVGIYEHALRKDPFEFFGFKRSAN